MDLSCTHCEILVRLLGSPEVTPKYTVHSSIEMSSPRRLLFLLPPLFFVSVYISSVFLRSAELPSATATVDVVETESIGIAPTSRQYESGRKKQWRSKTKKNKKELLKKVFGSRYGGNNNGGSKGVNRSDRIDSNRKTDTNGGNGGSSTKTSSSGSSTRINNGMKESSSENDAHIPTISSNFFPHHLSRLCSLLPCKFSLPPPSEFAALRDKLQVNQSPLPWDLPVFSKCNPTDREYRDEWEEVGGERLDDLRRLSRLHIDDDTSQNTPRKEGEKSDDNVHSILLVGDSTVVQMGWQSVLCALISGGFTSEDNKDNDDRIKYELYNAGLTVGRDGTLMSTIIGERGNDDDDEEDNEGSDEPPSSAPTEDLPAFIPTLILYHPTFSRPVTITGLHTYSYSPYTFHTVESLQKKQGVENQRSLHISALSKIQQAYETVVYNHGLHHRVPSEKTKQYPPDESPVDFYNPSPQADKIRREYRDTIRDLALTASKHKHGRGYLLETLPQLYPNLSGLYSEKDSRVRTEDREGKLLCTGPLGEEGGAERLLGEWRNVILSEEVKRVNSEEITRGCGEVTIVPISTYFTQLKDIRRANLLIPSALDCTHFIDCVPEASRLFHFLA